VDANNGRISSAGRYVTDSRGEITLTDVTGTIVVTETKAAEGYYIQRNSI
jgi:hypothetical protein